MSRLPTLNGLQAFEATARHMSFARAADELSLTPSAVSYQVKTLEDRLGTPLFVRLNRAIQLTEDGQALFPELREAFARMRLAVDRLSADTPENVLVVSTGPSFAAKWLSPRLFSFMDAHPEVEIRISASLKLVDFARDSVDVGIRFGPGRYPGLEIIRLMGDELTAVVSPAFLRDHPLCKPKDILPLPHIIDESMAFTPQAPTWKEWLVFAGVTHESDIRGLRFNHADHAIDAAIRGAGIALARTSLAKTDIESGLLVEPFPDLRLTTDLAFYLVMPPAARFKPKVAAFTDWMLQEIGSDGDGQTTL
ncbi:MAG: transcriptional regulator GcvA [Pseudomonadota bacterium]